MAFYCFLRSMVSQVMGQLFDGGTVVLSPQIVFVSIVAIYASHDSPGPQHQADLGTVELQDRWP